jgi:hypothetical protein
MAFRTVTGTFTSSTQSASFVVNGERTGGLPSAVLFNVTLSGTFSATVTIERSFDDGSTWHPVAKNTDGDAAAYTAPVSLTCAEPEGSREAPVLYRLNCTHASGTVTYRVSA